MYKRKWSYGIVVAGICWLPLGSIRSQSPVDAIISMGIGRVIRAFDLKVQRMQTNTIWLQEAQKKLENAMQALHLDEIRDWVEQMRDLYSAYFEELWRVKAVIGNYYQVRTIMDKEKQLVTAYHLAWAQLGSDKHFTPAERAHMQAVYHGILDESVKELDLVLSVIRDFVTQMPDEGRLAMINRVAAGIDRRYNDLLQFNHENAMLSWQRTATRVEADEIRRLYGLE